MGNAAFQEGLQLRILTYLAEAYRPVVSDWVDCSEIARALGVPVAGVELQCRQLESQTLIEVAPADEENANAAAVITVKGLLAIGRVP